MSQVIGLDIGHSTVKVSIKGRTFLFPTAVMPARTIHDEAEASRCASETFEANGRKYFIGETALVQGGQIIGLSDNWIESPEHAALMKAGMAKAIEAGASPNSSVVLGLPAHAYGQQKARLKDLGQQHLGTEVLVLSQPFGPFNQHMLVDGGGVRDVQALANDSWAVVEIGFFTTDFALIQKNRWVAEGSASCSGAHIAAEHLQRSLLEKHGISADLAECDEALKTRTIRNFGKLLDVSQEVNAAVAVLSDDVLGTATRLFENHARKLNGVILAGGGAPLLHAELAGKWGNLVLADKPRFSVSEGLRRFGEMRSVLQSMAS